MHIIKNRIMKVILMQKDKHKCGIVINNIIDDDDGIWLCDIVSRTKNGSHISKEKQQKLDVENMEETEDIKKQDLNLNEPAPDNTKQKLWRSKVKKKNRKYKYRERSSMFRSGSSNNNLDDLLQSVIDDTNLGPEDNENLMEKNYNNIRSVSLCLCSCKRK